MNISTLTWCYALCHTLAGNFQFAARTVNPLSAAYADRLRRFAANWETLATAMVSETNEPGYASRVEGGPIPILTPGFSEDLTPEEKAVIVLNALLDGMEAVDFPRDHEPEALRFLSKIFTHHQRVTRIICERISKEHVWDAKDTWTCRACGLRADAPQETCECCGAGQSLWESAAMFAPLTN